ncbi:MAG: putative alpha/beta-hydrolase family hydrolase [Alteromonadaceae bacterium]|jgi:predicted alpha/beta-hydrolase family hydrolase
MDKQHVSITTPAIKSPVARFLFAHGAGASMDTDFMVNIAEGLAAQQIEVVRFNFPYMQTMSETGKRRPPNRMPALLEYFTELVNGVDDGLPLFIGGKSMGGRASTMLATQSELKNPIKGVLALGYPFHPAGKPDKLRIDHLPDMLAPCLIIQGDRDSMGNQQDIAGYNLPNQLEVAYLTDGEHGFKPRKASGVTLQDNLAIAIAHMVRFINDNR